MSCLFGGILLSWMLMYAWTLKNLKASAICMTKKGDFIPTFTGLKLFLDRAQEKKRGRKE